MGGAAKNIDTSAMTKDERYNYILDSVIEMIPMTASDPDGEIKIYSENQLARMLGVSRAHVREVYSALNLFGFLESRRGEGTFLKTSDSEMPYKLLFLIISHGGGAMNIDYIMEARKVIEVGVAEKAALNRSEKAVHDLKRIVAEMEKCNDGDRLSELDNRLHTIIGQSCGNPMLIGLSNVISGVVINAIREHWNNIIFERNTGIKKTTFEQHSELVEAIANRKPYIAKVVAEEHVSFVTESLKRYKVINQQKARQNSEAVKHAGRAAFKR